MSERDPEPLRFLDLGPLAISTAGGEKSPGGAKPRRILATLLISANQRVAVDRLIECVWGDDASPASVPNLETTVWRLRRLLEPDRPAGTPSNRLINDAGGYRLLVNSSEADSLRFAALAEQAADLLRAGDPGRALRACNTALDLWRGRAFEEVADDVWAAPAVARLDELRVDVRQSRLDAYLRLGDQRHALSDAESLTAEFPFRESLWQRRMLVLYQSGRTEEALDAYGAAREALLEHAGLEPGPQLRDLQHRILQQDPELDQLFGPAPVTAPEQRTEVQLPVRLSPLVGREQDVERLVALIGAHQLVTIIGAAGCGKTRLAIEAARGSVGTASEGIWFFDLTAIDTPDLLVSGMISTLGLSAPTGGPPVEALRAFVRDRRVLFVLDNCEHLLTAVGGLVERLLVDEPECRVLATSREPLDVDGEVLWSLRPLPTDRPDHPADELPAPDDVRCLSVAGTMFRTRAEATDPQLRVDANAVERIESICRSVDGLPLAIELAAGRLRSSGLAEIADQTARDPLTLRRFGRADVDHHQTLQSALDWSHRLLPERAQVLHRRLSVLPGSFTQAAAVAAAGWDPLSPPEVPDLLDLLVHRSLLSPASADRAGPSPLAQLATVRAHASQQLYAAGEVHDARRHRNEAISRLIDGRPAPTVADQGWHRMVEDNHETLRAVLQDQLVDHPTSEGARLAAQLGFYWYFRSRLVEGEQWSRLAREIVDADPLDRAMVDAQLAFVLTLRDRLDLAEPLVHSALGTAVARPELIIRIFFVAWAAWQRGSARFEFLTGELKSLSQDSGDTATRSFAQLLAIRTGLRGGDPASVAAAAESVYTQAEAAGNALAATVSSYLMCICAIIGRDPAAGSVWLRRAVERQTSLGISHSANMLEFDAALACLSGRFDDAVRVFAASRSIARRSGTPWPFTIFAAPLLDRARAALDGAAFDSAWTAGQQDPQRLYVERFDAEWAAGGGDR